MELNLEQLPGHLSRQLASCYLIAGEELLRQQQALDLLLAAARQRGFHERQRLDGELSPIDWSPLENLGQSSLFASQSLIQLDFMTGKISAPVQKLLQNLPEPNSDEVVIIRVNLSERKVKDSSWFKALAQRLVLVSCPLVSREHLPHWLLKQAQHLGLKLTPSALNLLTDRLEGNLLAAAQELDKLKLLYDSTLIDADIIDACVANSAHFDIYRLVDAFTSSNAARALSILRQMKTEAQEPVLILWALQRECRLLAQLADNLNQGQTWSQLCQQHRLWPARAKPMHQCLQQRPAIPWSSLLLECQRIDACIKGQETKGLALWPRLESLVMALCGQALTRQTSLAKNASA